MSYIHVLLNHVAQDFVYETTLGWPTGGLGVQELKKIEQQYQSFPVSVLKSPGNSESRQKVAKGPQNRVVPFKYQKDSLNYLLLDLGPQTQNILYPGVSHLC